MATLLIVAETAVGCGGSTSPNGGSSVFTTVAVTPSAATLFTAAPGNTVKLAVVPQDQNGKTFAGAGAPSFTSDNSAIATVGNDGMVTVVAAGTVRITTSVTAGSITQHGITTVTAQIASATAAVVAPGMTFQPAVVDVQPGGSVSWAFGATPHNVVFASAEAPGNVAELQDGSASRTFPTHGTFGYRCTIHQGMAGTVNVH
jgi:plastocyanin